MTECPAVVGSKQFKPDNFIGECYELNENERRPVQKYTFSRNGNSVSWSSMFQDSLEFTVSYYRYLELISEDLKEWASNNREEVKLLSKTCNYRGVLEESITLDRETHYVCNCLKDYHGQNCKVDKELYQSV